MGGNRPTHHPPTHLHTFTLTIHPPQTVDESERAMVRVRFVNTPDGKDVVAVAREGDNLMKVGRGVFVWD